MDNVSNYLLAFGKTEKINQLQSWFDQPDEINAVHLKDGFSLMSVSKGSSFQRTDDGFVFFTGWIQDHYSESIVLGEEGYLKWSSSKDAQSKENEGAHVVAHYSNNRMTVRNDMFSYFPVIYFIEKDLFVCSDSLFMLSKVRKFLNLPCRLNQSVMHSRAWTHGLACAVMGNHTQIEGVDLLSPGKHIELNLKNRIFGGKRMNTKSCVKSTPLKELFSTSFSEYKQSIRDATEKFAKTCTALLSTDEIVFKFGLSGGLDSRIILAALLQKPEQLNKVSINTNTHPSRIKDFNVVQHLASTYQFEFNSDEQIRQHKKKWGMKLKKIDDKFALWVVSSLGLFDMMYLHDSYWPVPHIAEIGGHGAETVKGTFAPMKFEHYLKEKKVTNKAKFSRRGFSHIKAARLENIVHDAIKHEMKSSLASSGIDLDEYGSIQWHHFCYKSPIQNGRYLDRTLLAIRPFIQQSLFSLAISDINPFRHAKRGEPTLLHDMLILLHPELAGEAFENPKSDITNEHIQSRLEELGGPLTLSESEPYTFYGTIQNLKNGPCQAFLKHVPKLFAEDDDVMKNILATMESVWSSIQDDNLRKVYQSAYETAKERLTDPDYYPPSAGAPAAKIISHVLFD